MQKKWYSILPWVTLTSGVLVILLLASAVIFKPSRNIENTVNRKFAYDQLKQVRVESAGNLNSKAFLDYFDKTLSCSVITTKWLISEKGDIVYAKGEMAASTPVNSNIYSLANEQDRGLIDAVESNVDSVQKSIMYVASAIRREGEHNDIYGHLVMPLKTESNVLVGFAGVAYVLNDAKPATQIFIVSIALIIGFLLYWLSLPLWVYFDCREQNSKYTLWTIFVLIGNIPAFIAYLISSKK